MAEKKPAGLRNSRIATLPVMSCAQIKSIIEIIATMISTQLSAEMSVLFIIGNFVKF